jgi:hypothetical protein
LNEVKVILWVVGFAKLKAQMDFFWKKTDLETDCWTDLETDCGTDLETDCGTDLETDCGTDLETDCGTDCGTDYEIGGTCY